MPDLEDFEHAADGSYEPGNYAVASLIRASLLGGDNLVFVAEHPSKRCEDPVSRESHSTFCIGNTLYEYVLSPAEIPQILNLIYSADAGWTLDGFMLQPGSRALELPTDRGELEPNQLADLVKAEPLLIMTRVFDGDSFIVWSKTPRVLKLIEEDVLGR